MPKSFCRSAAALAAASLFGVGFAAGNEWIVSVDSPAVDHHLRNEPGVDDVRPLAGLSHGRLVRVAHILSESGGKAMLLSVTGVRHAEPNRTVRLVPQAFSPTDPLFGANQGTGYLGQWHLHQPTNPGIDLRVLAGWERNIVGRGAVVGIVDDGVERLHRDLAANRSEADSAGFGGLTTPWPDAGAGHGTAMAGLAVARGGNAIGGLGAAPFARWASLRVPVDTDLATLIQVVGFRNQEVPLRVFGKLPETIFATSEGVESALRQAAQNGVLVVLPAGNARGLPAADAAKRAFAGSPDALFVAGVGADGVFTGYSGYGSNVFVAAPAGHLGQPGPTTTDRTGADGYNAGAELGDADFTTSFRGTSAAAANLVGALALVKEAYPALDLRMAKHLLVRTSDPVDPNDASASSFGGWRTNGAGYRFNPNYGFGLVDADGLLASVLSHAGVSPLHLSTVPTQNVGEAIPDGDGTRASRSFTIASSEPLEEVLVRVRASHPRRGDLQITLRSPSGTISRLGEPNADDLGSDLDWTFQSVAFWGENPQGDWTLEVEDVSAGASGVWNDFSAVLRSGRLLAAPPLDSVQLSASTLTAGAPLTATLTLSQPAPGNGVRIQVRSSSPSIVTPLWATVARGNRSTTVNLVTRSVLSPTDVRLTFQGANTVERTVRLLPNLVNRVLLSPSMVYETQSSVGTVELMSPAPPSGSLVRLTGPAGVVGIPATVLVPGGQRSASFPVRTFPTAQRLSAAVAATLNGATRTARLEIVPVTVAGMAIQPTRVRGGLNVQGTVTLSAPAPPNGLVVGLSDNSPATSPPLWVRVAPGSRIANFTIGTVPASVTRIATVTATARATSRSATVTVDAIQAELRSFTVSPSSVLGGRTASGRVEINIVAPPGGITVALSSSISQARVPPTAIVPAGSRVGTFVVQTVAGSEPLNATLLATLNGLSRVATLQVAPLTVDSISAAPDRISSNGATTVTVRLTGPAPTAGLVVRVSSNNSSLVNMPPTVTVQAGQSSVSFRVSVRRVNQRTGVTLFAMHGLNMKTGTLTVDP